MQAGDLYVYWKKYDDRLALIEPDLETRSTGDAESKSSVGRLFTGRVVADVPVLAHTPQQGTIIDMVELLVNQAPKFFGYGGHVDPKTIRLREIKTAKAFPHNVELAFELPFYGGKLKTLHFSISEIPDHTGYQPRQADDRVGYFTTAFDDLGKFKKNETRVRYINRWHLEKADPSLKMSPPKQPIVFYIEHTTPIRYRRFVRDGVLYWNKAFEKVGLVERHRGLLPGRRHRRPHGEGPGGRALQLRALAEQQHGHGDRPEPGPSADRANPRCGHHPDRRLDSPLRQIICGRAAQAGDGGVRAGHAHLAGAQPAVRPALPARPGTRAQSAARAVAAARRPAAGGTRRVGPMLGNREFDGLVGRVSQVNGLCLAAEGKAFDLALLRMSADMLLEEEAKNNPGQANKDADDNIDGVPARYIGPLMADLVAHEVGHTLGLRHNFKASSLYSLADINSQQAQGSEAVRRVGDGLPADQHQHAGRRDAGRLRHDRRWPL